MSASAGITIRRAGPADAAVVAGLRYRFRTESEAPAEPETGFIERSIRWMAEHLAGESTWRCWVAAADREVVGTLWLQLVEKLPNPNAHLQWHGYISSFYVIPTLRNRGIGTDLMAACLRDCDSEGVDAVFLWPTDRSRPFYERYGFRVRDDLLERR